MRNKNNTLHLIFNPTISYHTCETNLEQNHLDNEVQEKLPLEAMLSDSQQE